MEKKQDIGGRRSKRLILKRNKENGVSNESSNYPVVEQINRGNSKISYFGIFTFNDFQGYCRNIYS